MSPMNKFLCPARESSRYLCDRDAEYLVDGALWCNTHARRIIESKTGLASYGIMMVGLQSTAKKEL
jgi:hypothetical protein